MFSPYYVRAHARGQGDPKNHCAMNIALYGPCKRWAMTERRAGSLDRSDDHIAIGPSALHWHGDALTAEINEVAVPIPRQVRGRIKLYPAAVEPQAYTLDPAGQHRWQPIAPCAHIEVSFTDPALSWQGCAYLDTNSGDVPLATSFAHWHWSRAATRKGATIFYDVTPLNAPPHSLALTMNATGGVTQIEPPPHATLSKTLWRVPRETRADVCTAPRVLKTLEDAPFYARSLIASQLHGEAVHAIHESLSLPRFAAPWVRTLLPFRMPRALQ